MRRTVLALLLAIVATNAAIAADEAVLAPPASLVADGLPSVPRALVDEVGRYTEFRSAGFADWHPVEHRAADLHPLRQHDADPPREDAGRRPHAADLLRRAGDRRPLRAERRRVLPLHQGPGGNEFRQIYRDDLADGQSRCSPTAAARRTAHRWSNAGDRIAYGSTRRNGADRDLYVMDPLQRQSDRRLLEVKGGGWGSPTGRPTTSSCSPTRTSRSTRAASGWSTSRPARRRGSRPTDEEPSSWATRSSTPTASRLYVITDRGEEFAYLGLLDLATERVTRAQRATSTGTSTASTIAATVAPSPSSSTRRRCRSSTCSTPARGAERPRSTACPPGSIGGLGFHPDGTRLGLRRRRPAHPLRRLLARRRRRQAWSAGPRARSAAVARRPADAEVIRWKSFDGREITGFLYRPPARFTGKRPVMIIIHGGPEGQSRPAFRGRWNYLLDRARRRASSTPTCAARRATARPSSSSTTACGGKTRSRTSGRCSTGSRSRPTSTPRGC